DHAILPAWIVLLAPRIGRGQRRDSPQAGAQGEGSGPETLTLSRGFALSGSRFAPSPKGRGWIRLLPMIFVALVYLALRYSVLGGLGIPVSAQYMGGRLTYFERLLTSGRVFIRYLFLLFYLLIILGVFYYYR